MTPCKLTSSFDFWSRVISAWPWRICPPTLVQRSTPNSEYWHPLPSWFFKLCEFGTFHHVNSEVLEFCTKFGSNICYSHWDQCTYAPDVHLITSSKLSAGSDFCSHGHLRMAIKHLPLKFGENIFIQSGVMDIFPKIKMAAATILDFQVMWIWHIPACWQCGTWALYQIWFKYLLSSLRSTHLWSIPSFDDVTQINLVTWWPSSWICWEEPRDHPWRIICGTYPL